MTPMYTRFVWDSPTGLEEYAVPSTNLQVIPPRGAAITTRFPVEGRFEKITGIVDEVSADYTANEVVVHITDVEIL